MGPVSAFLARRRRFLTQYLRVMVSLAKQRDLLFVPELIHRPEGERALVLSPHCDDDVIGLGAMMHCHGLAGHDVTIVYFTTPASRGRGRSNQGEVRKQEAREATELLGTFNLLFLDQPEGKLKPDRQLTAELSSKSSMTRVLTFSIFHGSWTTMSITLPSMNSLCMHILGADPHVSSTHMKCGPLCFPIDFLT